ncbi:YwqJ-related putative deaminase, partial [Streptomyces sp. NPDC059104]
GGAAAAQNEALNNGLADHGMPANPLRKALDIACGGGTKPCDPKLLQTLMQAQGANADQASAMMNAAAPYVGGALGGVLGGVLFGPGIAAGCVANAVLCANELTILAAEVYAGLNGMPVGTGASVLTGVSSPAAMGSAVSVEARALGEARLLIAEGSKNPAVSVGGAAALGIQTPPFSNILAKVPTFPGVKMSADGDTFVIVDQGKFMDAIAGEYGRSGQKLNGQTVRQIEGYIASHDSFPTMAGIPGLHAEVQSLNYIYNAVPNPATLNLADISIATIKLGRSSAAGTQGGAFTACQNCSGIIPPKVNVITGRQ